MIPLSACDRRHTVVPPENSVLVNLQRYTHNYHFLENHLSGILFLWRPYVCNKWGRARDDLLHCWKVHFWLGRSQDERGRFLYFDVVGQYSCELYRYAV